ncbi:copper resistance protein CopC [Amycolatopsis sp.]|uniref:copper resistance CopC/CopD family protein n=1 Tax=Amycolatopsis sp. TaxID=37632 RepID=UPI00262F6A15|nr:copper resistance protein CopC [Amycolatopsis sp.]
MGKSAGRTRRAVWTSAIAVVFWLVLPSPAASAHATLLGSTPSAGYAVATAPTAVTLDFDEAVSISTSPLTLLDTAGHPFTLGRPALSLGGRRLSAPVPEWLADGGYRVHWEVTAQDGDLVDGAITFAVGAGTAVPSGDANGGSAIDSPVVIVLRWALFSGLFVALGGAVGAWLARRVTREARSNDVALDGPRPLLAIGAGLGALAAAGLAVDQVGVGFSTLTSSAAGLVLIVELVAFLVSAVLAILARSRPGSGLEMVAAMPLVAVVVAEGLRAHPHADSPVLGAALTIVHLLAAGAWVGALVHVLRTARAWRGRPGWTRLLVYDYARLAVVLLVLVVATGTAEALIVLPSVASLVDTFYGVVLLAKIVLVAAVIVLAVVSRRRLSRSRRTRTEHPLGRSVRAEAVVLAGVLVVTSVLVSVAPARPVSDDLAAPPPVTGLVVPAGTLAGQVTVIATASAGQLVIRMSTPDRDDLGTDDADSTGAASGPPPYRLAASVTSDGPGPDPLTMRGCGAGCFTTPITWRTGVNHLQLSIAAGPWHAGNTTLDIPWPARTDSSVLPEVLTAMHAVPHLTLHEAVTSDYNGYPGTEATLPLSGTEFLATEPYGNGGVTPVALATTETETEIGLVFPQGLVVRLFLDTNHRILREEYVTPNHLITRTFEYPH